MTNEENNQFNRLEFFRNILPLFLGRYNEESLDLTLHGCLYLAANGSTVSPQVIEEKIKILENCCSEFKKDNLALPRLIVELKKQSREIGRTLTHEKLLQIIEGRIADTVLDVDKRKYNMSTRYFPNQIQGDSIKLEEFKGMRVKLPGKAGSTVSIQQIGTLNYKTLSSTESIDKFQVTKTFEDDSEYKATIFSHIDLNKLNPLENPREFDREYCIAVLSELLSQDNIELSGVGGYVGDIVDTRTHHVQLKPGQKKEHSEDEFYRYQISKNMAIEFDPQELSAVVLHSNQEAEKEKQAKEKQQAEQIEQAKRVFSVRPVTPDKPGQSPSDDDGEPAL